MLPSEGGQSWGSRDAGLCFRKFLEQGALRAVQTLQTLAEVEKNTGYVCWIWEGLGAACPTQAQDQPSQRGGKKKKKKKNAGYVHQPSFLLVG